jgi:hypothetical protein
LNQEWNKHIQGIGPAINQSQRFLDVGILAANIFGMRFGEQEVIRVFVTADNVFQDGLARGIHEELGNLDDEKDEHAHGQDEVLKRLVGDNTGREICGQQRRHLGRDELGRIVGDLGRRIFNIIVARRHGER